MNPENSLKPDASEEHRTLSDERATEIFLHLNDVNPTSFTATDTNRKKRFLSEQAVRIVLETDKIPEHYQQIINAFFPAADDFKDKRVGKQMSPERAAILLAHLNDIEKDPHWRESDTTVIIRKLLRDAIILKVMALEKPADQLTTNEKPLLVGLENACEIGTTPAEVLHSDLMKVDRQYPLAA